jgi:hypothetical protein
MNKHTPIEVRMTEKLVLTGLTKRYGNHLAVDGLELQVKEGISSPSSAPADRARPQSST